MRVTPDYIYKEYKEGVSDAFHRLGRKGWETAKNITDCMAYEDDELLVKDSTSLALWIISVAEYEIRHDILEERVHLTLSYYVPRFINGEYNEDLSEEEIEQVNADVDYILSKVKLYENVEFYDDEE